MVQQCISLPQSFAPSLLRCFPLGVMLLQPSRIFHPFRFRIYFHFLALYRCYQVWLLVVCLFVCLFGVNVFLFVGWFIFVSGFISYEWNDYLVSFCDDSHPSILSPWFISTTPFFVDDSYLSTPHDQNQVLTKSGFSSSSSSLSSCFRCIDRCLSQGEAYKREHIKFLYKAFFSNHHTKQKSVVLRVHHYTTL